MSDDEPAIPDNDGDNGDGETAPENRSTRATRRGRVRHDRGGYAAHGDPVPLMAPPPSSVSSAVAEPAPTPPAPAPPATPGDAAADSTAGSNTPNTAP